MKKIILFLALWTINFVQAQTISAVETLEYCPNVENTFTVIIPGIVTINNVTS